jgi:hypothetical protein
MMRQSKASTKPRVGKSHDDENGAEPKPQAGHAKDPEQRSTMGATKSAERHGTKLKRDRSRPRPRLEAEQCSTLKIGNDVSITSMPRCKAQHDQTRKIRDDMEQLDIPKLTLQFTSVKKFANGMEQEVNIRAGQDSSLNEDLTWLR